MATRDDLHRLVEELPASDIELAADVLDTLTLADAAERQADAAAELRRAIATVHSVLLSMGADVRFPPMISKKGFPGRKALPVLPEPPYPRSVGSLTRAPADLSSNLDDYLADGFGQ